MAGFRWVTVQRMTRAAGRALRGTHLALARPRALASLLAAPLLALPALALPAHAQGTAPQPDAPLTAPPVVDPKPVETTPVSPAGRSVAPQEVTLAPVPVLTLAGNATWEEAYDRLVASVKQVNDELARLGLARAGDTFIVYTSSDDLSFEYEVQVPFSGTTTQKPGSGMKLGGSHAGKVLKFAHTGSFSGRFQPGHDGTRRTHLYARRSALRRLPHAASVCGICRGYAKTPSRDTSPDRASEA